MTHPMIMPTPDVKVPNTMIPLDNQECHLAAPAICGMDLIVLAAAVAHFGRGLGEEVLVALSWTLLNRHAFDADRAIAGTDDWAAALLADPVEQETARVLAVFTQVVAGAVDDPTNGATRFHCHDETPTWTETMDIRAVIGPYLFYAGRPKGVGKS